MNHKTFYIESLGCAKNQVDSEQIITLLTEAGWEYKKLPDDANLIIVNTCGFIREAKEESIETGIELKVRYPDKKILMAGCLTERYGDELSGELTEIDGFIGNECLQEVVPAAESIIGNTASSTPSRTQKTIVRNTFLTFPGSAYVKIAEGCDNRCSYCSIPLIRGDLKSRNIISIIEEIEDLLHRGIREINLIAQDLGSFGRDNNEDLQLLLKEIASLKSDFWIRLLYIHPDHFPYNILPLLSQDSRFLPYFDIPFQHASKSILTAMGRKGDIDTYLSLISKIRARIPQAIIRSTFLVGFPGETDEDFTTLLHFQQKAHLDWLGTFIYSKEEDTKAYDLKEHVKAGIAKKRKEMLEEKQVAITHNRLDLHIGKTCDVLIEEPIQGENLTIGRAYYNAPEVDGLVVLHGNEHPPGTMVKAKIIRRNGFDLEAVPVS